MAEGQEYAPLRFILEGHLIDCYEMMYWPFIVDTLAGDTQSSLLWRSYARKGLENAARRISKNEKGFHRRHHGTWLMLRSCTRSALTLIACKLAGMDSLLPPDWEIAIQKTIKVLRFWEAEAEDVADRARTIDHLSKIATGG